MKSAENTPELLAEHAKATGGHVITRFPPEPNGFLHIGHAKSMNLNFKGAFQALKVTNGKTIFRYDDTNPEAESQEYIDSQVRARQVCRRERHRPLRPALVYDEFAICTSVLTAKRMGTRARFSAQLPLHRLWLAEHTAF